jgi:hypothetical protein
MRTKSKSLEKLHQKKIKKLHPETYSAALLNGAIPAPEIEIKENYDISWADYKKIKLNVLPKKET